MATYEQIHSCTSDLRRTAFALLNAAGPVTMTKADLAAMGVQLMDVSAQIETALAENVVQDILRREEARVIDAEFHEVRS
ncbi:hypothetical protein AA12717_0371 [Gluconacetobacter sacchari DSM 12717]|uniref:Uncharacterized protein n=2 Tax=Gluconacetobacter sacchari TaxID=92759 RepID=A0A7W4IC64_9PROT|nr:hypothetical protein [Gluconacetobacter sacchari]MBB2160112.1 hypothetical protein [Gluconacetobacter sacchari]GBQ19848.1 hypothetical protein AA12717_0371 [Gluconacetobacter sacchari DSM 12717]